MSRRSDMQDQKDKVTGTNGRKMRALASASLRGSFTLEASFVVPMILFCLAAMTAAGFDQARLFLNDVADLESVWEEEHETEQSLARTVRIAGEVRSLTEVFAGDD